MGRLAFDLRSAPHFMNDSSVMDFYVAPLARSGSEKVEWLICRGTLLNCVAVRDDVDVASAQAIRMAEYATARTGRAEVHVQDNATRQWHTVWSSFNAVTSHEAG